MIKQGRFHADKIKYPDGVGCCIWIPFSDEDDDIGTCMDIYDTDIDDMIALLQRLREIEAEVLKDGE
jgi:hypothetical protein